MAPLMAMMTLTSANAQVYLDPQAPIESRVKDALSRMTTHEKIKVLHAQSKFTSAGVPRLGIRQLNMDDGPHGVREELEWNTWNPARWTNDYCVAFPSLTCLAATWNRDLSAVYGNAISEEFAYRGKDLLLGPGVNIQRTPLNGRAFEYMGEDPYLAGEMAVPYIVAAQKNGVGCCLKHYVLNDQETDRFAVNVNVSERALREIYLYPFEQAVKRAHVWSIMGSYNLWQNVHCCHNDALINGILKKEWGWDGALVSDWGGTTNTQEAVFGGLDIEMGTFTDGKLRESEFGYDDYYLAKPFEQLINDGKVPMSVLDDKVARVLRLMFRTGMNPQKVIGSMCSEAHYEACRQIGEEGIVMLKNEKDILPLSSYIYNKVLVVGENATRSLTQGGGSSELKTLKDVSPLEAISSQLSTLNSQLSTDYAQGYMSGRAMYDRVDRVDPAKQAELKAEALEKAKTADLIIFIGGLNKNHRQDCENGDRESYDLSFGQNELISELAKIQKNIIVVTFGGNPYAMPWINDVRAVLHCWYLGSEAGNALVNVLTGKVNPSGKLPVTIAQNYEDYPYVKFGTEAYPGVNKQVYYKEDVFVGYRWTDRKQIKPLFPFGYGLSYTTFQVSNLRADKKEMAADDQLTITADVKNVGSLAGAEVLQLYISDTQSSQPRPVKELKGFKKVYLEPGETQQVSFIIDRSALSFYDEKTGAWTAEPGEFVAMVNNSSAPTKNHIRFILSSKTMQ